MTTQNRGFGSQPQRQSQHLSPNLRRSQRQRGSHGHLGHAG